MFVRTECMQYVMEIEFSLIAVINNSNECQMFNSGIVKIKSKYILVSYAEIQRVKLKIKIKTGGNRR